MERILEPELMEDRDQSVAYAEADFSDSNKAFVKYIKDDLQKANLVLDAGCGPCNVSILMVEENPTVKIVAVDGAKEMVRIANQQIEKAGLVNKIDARAILLSEIPDEGFDLIVAKDILHHIPNPHDFWAEMQRIARTGVPVFVMDLLRPDSVEMARKMVEEVTGKEAKVLQEDFYNSLLAAFSIPEVIDQLEDTDFSYEIEEMGSRHFIVRCTKD